MFEILSVQTKEEQKNICELCGVAFDINCMAYAVRDNGRIIGVSQFRILGGYAVVYHLANARGIDDVAALTVLGKASLNFIDLCGIQDVILKAVDQDLPHLLGFTQDELGVWRVNLEGYFKPCTERAE